MCFAPGEPQSACPAADSRGDGNLSPGVSLLEVANGLGNRAQRVLNHRLTEGSVLRSSGRSNHRSHGCPRAPRTGRSACSRGYGGRGRQPIRFGLRTTSRTVAPATYRTESLGAELTMGRAWRLLTFGDVRSEGLPFAGALSRPVGVDFADGDQRLCRPASDEG